MRYSLSKENLHSSLVNGDLTRLDKLLLILFWDNEKSKSASEIQNIGSDNGLRECKKWNVSDTLGKSKGKATSIKGGWIITTSGKDYLKDAGLIAAVKTQVKNDVADLKTSLIKVKNANTLSFIEEAILCLEAGHNRAAVVYSWIGAVSILYDHVVAHHLTNFNNEAIKRDSKWKIAKNSDDLSRMKEHDFLNVLEAISVIGKNVKQELQQCLQLRNGCGHPNSLKFGDRKVAAHIEILLLNVYSIF